MLATMSSSNHDIPLREHSHLNIQHDSREQGDFAIDDRLCPGCTKSAVSEHGGLVVAFGYVSFPL
jgi:Rho-type GTPase-activating protein 1/2